MTEIKTDDDGGRDRMSMRQLAGVLPTVTTQLQPIPVSNRAVEILRRTGHLLSECMAKGTHHVLQGSQLGVQLDCRHPRTGPYPFLKEINTQW